MKAEAVIQAAVRGLATDNIVPEGSLGLLLQALSAIPVSPSTSVDTAAIRRTATGYEILLNPDFCVRYVRDDTAALALVGHELLHARRGHFGLTVPRCEVERSLLNVALDVLVNSALLRTWVPDACPLFREVNAWDCFPSCMLVPPHDVLAALRSQDDEARFNFGGHRAIAVGWTRGRATTKRLERVFTRHFTALGVRKAGAIARLYLRGWLEVMEPTAYWVSFRALVLPELRHRPGALEEVRFLGDHEAPGRGGEGLVSPEPGGAGEEDVARVGCRRATTAARIAFLRAVNRALVVGAADGPEGLGWRPTPGVIPGVGRRDVMSLAAGVLPPLWSPNQLVAGEGQSGVHLFVDVSGSTTAFQAVYFGLVAALGPQLVRPAWQFSTEVYPLTEPEAREGRLRTRHGTDIECVIEHARTHRMRRLLWLTDGEFDVPPPLARKARGMQIVMLLTSGVRVCHSAAALRATVVEVPPEIMGGPFFGADDIPF